ncbi:YhjD/YihY/BrkB family envelope integrity protein [Planobispora takensis]|uniref:Uncharacterized protein n=1 Tax=Planobispora takensis TaxID=1367882 RepID=A0A8J3SZJ7_9ACTN|nr:YhjD/YihY/BrkB family envelope integrity protein [Planobispora takensis]GIH98383.1 hypothetical protein Pta02_03920 [Planobispora takensis]
MRERLLSLARWSGLALTLRCLQRFRHIDGRNRSLVIAGQTFTTIIPLLILTASVTGSGGSHAVGDELVTRFHLTGDSAEAMRTLFARPPVAAQTMSVIGLIVLLASLLSLTRSLQRVYEEAWGLPPHGIPGTFNGLAGVSLLVAQLIVLTLLTSALHSAPGGSFIAAFIRILAAIPLWGVLQYLLLSRRIPIRRLVPGAIVAACGQLVVTMASAYWMPRVIENDAGRYGLIGVTFALISWLIIIGLGIVAAAVVGAELAPEDPAAGVPAGPGAPEASGASGAPGTSEAPRVT